jgi:chemotaxis response regulator CheB
MKDQIQESRIRLVLLDSHGLFRTSLSRLLASEPDLAVISECGTSAEALEVLHNSAVDVVRWISMSVRSTEMILYPPPGKPAIKAAS